MKPAILSALALSVLAIPARAADAPKPNLVFFLMDDMKRVLRTP